MTALLKGAFPVWKLGRWSDFARGGRRLRKGEAEADLATLGGGTCLALGALLGSFVGAQATDFFKDTFHFETGLETLKSAVNGFAFADLYFGHKSGLGWFGKRAARVGAGGRASNGMSKFLAARNIGHEVLLHTDG